MQVPLLYSRAGNEERRQRACEALAAVGLRGREDSRPNQLSGGQQQRVVIARALVNRPAIILADEPTGNLDFRTSVEVMALFQELNQEHGITVILVTHEPDIAEYANRVVVFKDGRIIGDSRVVYPRSASEELRQIPENPEDEASNQDGFFSLGSPSGVRTGD